MDGGLLCRYLCPLLQCWQRHQRFRGGGALQGMIRDRLHLYSQQEQSR